MLSVVMLSVIMLSVVMLSVVMLSVIMLSVVVVNVVALFLLQTSPIYQKTKKKQGNFYFLLAERKVKKAKLINKNKIIIKKLMVVLICDKSCPVL
jgi:hypothetical protein